MLNRNKSLLTGLSNRTTGKKKKKKGTKNAFCDALNIV